MMMANDLNCWTISGTFSPGWIKKISSLHKEVLFNYGEERKDEDWDSLWLSPPPLFVLFSLRREGKGVKEGRGERRRPQVTFRIISAMPAPGWMSRAEGAEEGVSGVKGKGVCVEVRGWGDPCVHFLCTLLGGSRRWIFTHSSPLHTPPCHWNVCENSTH